jgi:exosortase
LTNKDSMNGRTFCTTSNPPDHCLSERNEAGQQSGLYRTSWRELGVHNYIKILIIAVLFLHLFYAEIYRIVYGWLNDASWSHGFLIPLFSLYFLNQRKSQILNLRVQPNYLGLFFLICCIAAYPFIIFQLKVAYFQTLLMIPTLVAIVLFLGGWRLFKNTWLPILYLSFAVPLPGRLYRQITIPMRILAAKVATVLLNFFKEVDATVNGVIIDVVVNGKKIEPALDVAEACSGMRLLLTFFALGVAMAYLHYRPLWQRAILLLSTIPIAILCNIIRVTVTGFIYIFAGAKYTQNIYHDALGLAMLPLAFGLYGLLAYFMSRLLIEESPGVTAGIIVRRQN